MFLVVHNNELEYKRSTDFKRNRYSSRKGSTKLPKGVCLVTLIYNIVLKLIENVKIYRQITILIFTFRIYKLNSDTRHPINVCIFICIKQGHGTPSLIYYPRKNYI